MERVRDRPGVDREALAAAYRVDQRRKQIALEQRRAARQANESYDTDTTMTKEEIMRELRGY